MLEHARETRERTAAEAADLVARLVALVDGLEGSLTAAAWTADPGARSKVALRTLNLERRRDISIGDVLAFLAGLPETLGAVKLPDEAEPEGILLPVGHTGAGLRTR